jgi:hypothetical protein
MDWLIKMELANADLARAIDALKDVEGLEYLGDAIRATKMALAEELAEYKSTFDLELDN